MASIAEFQFSCYFSLFFQDGKKSDIFDLKAVHEGIFSLQTLSGMFGLRT